MGADVGRGAPVWRWLPVCLSGRLIALSRLSCHRFGLVA